MDEKKGAASRVKYPEAISAQVSAPLKLTIQNEADRRSEASGQWVAEAAVIRDWLAKGSGADGEWRTEPGHLDEAGAFVFGVPHTHAIQVWVGRPRRMALAPEEPS